MPPKPRVILRHSCRSLRKSSGQCDMHPEYLLSMHMTLESVPHCGTVRADDLASTDYAVSTVVNASIVAALLYL